MMSRFYVLLALSFCLFGCDPEEAPSDQLADWFENPTQAWPERLSAFNLYLEPQRDLTRVAKGARPYTPSYPLWSNGSEKVRHLIVPKGASIDATAEDDLPWRYPTGTVLFKTFVFETDKGLRPVETRVMRKLAEGDKWEYAHYQWDDAGRDATRLDMRKTVPVTLTLASGESLTHVIPNKLQCRSCHEASPRWVLGLSTRQFDAHRDVLNAWEVDKIISPTQLPALEGNALDVWVQGYFLGNCTHCHNGWGESPNSTYSLYPADYKANTIDRPTEGNASAVGTRVIPGDADQSVLYQAVFGYDDPELKEMPPIGVERRDQDAIMKLKTWINQLQ